MAVTILYHNKEETRAVRMQYVLQTNSIVPYTATNHLTFTHTGTCTNQVACYGCIMMLIWICIYMSHAVLVCMEYIQADDAAYHSWPNDARTIIVPVASIRCQWPNLSCTKLCPCTYERTACTNALNTSTHAKATHTSTEIATHSHIHTHRHTHMQITAWVSESNILLTGAKTF